MNIPRLPLSKIAAKIDYGLTASANEAQVGPKFLRITDIQEDAVDWDDVPFCEATPKKLAKARIEPGDIVFARTGATTGKSFLINEPPEDAVFASYLIRVRSSGRAIPSYLAHYFRSQDYWSQIKNRTRGAAQGGVNATSLGELDIPLPPLEEQRRIAGILDAADAMRRRRREALALLDTLPGAIFAEMFGDVGETHTLKEAGTDFRYGTSSKSQDHGLPVLRIPNVIGGDVDLSEIKTVPLSAKEEGRFALKDGDILLVRTNGNQAYVGRSAVFNHEKVAGHEMADATWSFASYLIRARLKEKQLLPDFIQGFLSSAAGRKQLLASSKTSAGQFNINTEALGAIRVPKVSVPAQAAFVDRVAEINNHRRQVLRHLSELETLFASLQSRAFAGEL